MAAALASTRELLTMPSPAVAAMVRQDPLDLLGLLRQQLGGQRAGITVGITEGGYVSADGRHRLVIAKPRQPPFDTRFSRLLQQRLDAIGAAERGAVRVEDDEPSTARGRVRGRAPHRARNRGRRQARKHPERRGVACADSPAPLPRVPQRVAPRLRRPAVDRVARRGARPDGTRWRDPVGRGNRSGRHALRPGNRRRGPGLCRASARAGPGAGRRGLGRDTRRAVGQHAPRNADHGRDVLRPGVRRFPEPAAARAGDRTQHGGVRAPHAGARAGLCCRRAGRVDRSKY